MNTFDVSAESSPPPPLEALERQITELAAHIHAATYRWLCLIAEFDRTMTTRLSWTAAAIPIIFRRRGKKTLNALSRLVRYRDLG